MTFRIITLFPEFFTGPLKTGLMGKAVASGKIRVEIIDLKSFSDDSLHRCDDYTYGGGSGMVLKAEPLFNALNSLQGNDKYVLLPSPSGTPLDQDIVKSLSLRDDIILICGHYEGIDQRVIDRFVDLEISLGDYVLSGGEYAALVILDAIARYVPGFLSNQESLKEESFEDGLLEYPQYTRPDEIEGMKVPAVLLSGDHEKIREWRTEKSVEKTRSRRSDLYRKYLLKLIRGE